MKKLFITASLALFMLSSCSDDDAATTNTSSMLPIKVVTAYGDEIITENITYNGNKIVKDAYSDGYYDLFMYTGDNITSIKSYSNDGTAVGEESFTYNSSNQLIKHVYTSYEDDSYGEKILFTYNANGTISTTQYSGNANAQNDLDGTGVMTVSNGNVMSYSFTNDGASTPQVNTYTFDDKNNPLKNVTGASAISIAYAEDGVNNIITRTGFGTTSTYAHTYNSANFPVKTVITTGNTTESTTDYTYN